MAAVAAVVVYKILGAKDLSVSNDYRREIMPPVNTGLLEGTSPGDSMMVAIPIRRTSLTSSIRPGSGFLSTRSGEIILQKK